MRGLLDAGVDIDPRDSEGMTPLHDAAWQESHETMMLLLEAGADANARTARGSTPLHRALGRLDVALEFVDALLSSGADVEARDLGGDTPLRAAANAPWSGLNPRLRAISVDADTRIVAVLLEAGADPKWNVDPAVVTVLIEAGADVNASDDPGSTPLFWAATGNRNPAVARELVQAGADLNTRRYDGRTPLHQAAQRNPVAFPVLFEAGADAEARDAEGRTPMNHARESPGTSGIGGREGDGECPRAAAAPEPGSPTALEPGSPTSLNDCSDPGRHQGTLSGALPYSLPGPPVLSVQCRKHPQWPPNISPSPSSPMSFRIGRRRSGW